MPDALPLTLSALALMMSAAHLYRRHPTSLRLTLALTAIHLLGALLYGLIHFYPAAYALLTITGGYGHFAAQQYRAFLRQPQQPNNTAARP
ncbi:hypothetical protein AB0H23_32700 [Streptomyces albogriseolus]|uniref:hypothetical protein n=1 Tax=Streptomyces albogriseolus TaxID=1887 RepID=UPI00345F53B2